MNFFSNTKNRFKVALCAILLMVVVGLLTTAITLTENAKATALSVDDPTATEYVDFETDYKVSLGEYTLTAYCPCTDCCGVWGENRPLDEYGDIIVYTASGEQAVEGITVASDLPLGSVLYINDHQYIVQDTGSGITDKRIDIYFDNHQDALNFGVQTAEVFIDKRR